MKKDDYNTNTHNNDLIRILNKKKKKKEKKETSLNLNGAMDLDQLGRGVFRRHIEDQSRFQPRENQCDGGDGGDGDGGGDEDDYQHGDVGERE